MRLCWYSVQVCIERVESGAATVRETSYKDCVIGGSPEECRLTTGPYNGCPDIFTSQTCSHNHHTHHGGLHHVSSHSSNLQKSCEIDHISNAICCQVWKHHFTPSVVSRRNSNMQVTRCHDDALLFLIVSNKTNISFSFCRHLAEAWASSRSPASAIE